MSKLFFDLIKVSLGSMSCLSHTPTADEWGRLYETAKKQSLVGVCFAGVQRLQAQQQEPPEMLYLKWMGMAAKIQQRNEVVNRQCVELQSKLSAEGLRSCILKGQSVAMLYDENLRGLRQSGDIDVWMGDSRTRVMEFVNKISPTNEVRWLHTKLPVFDDTEVELHFLPSYLECPWQDKVLQRFFEQEKEACMRNGAATLRMNRVFILAHAYRHLFGEGIGLRQLMDYYFVLLQAKPTAQEKTEWWSVISACGMSRFAKATMWIMKYVFGLSDEYMLCDANESDGRFLIDEVMKSGNFGHYDERLKHEVGESALMRFWRLTCYNFRVVKFSPWIVVCSPFWRAKHWIWRKSNGYK